MAKYFVIRQRRKFRNPCASGLEQSWTISIYDNEEHYRGAAYFETMEEAQAYMEAYRNKLIQKDLLHLTEKNHQPYLHSPPSFKIFEEDKIPMICLQSRAPKYETIQAEVKEQGQLSLTAIAGVCLSLEGGIGVF